MPLIIPPCPNWYESSILACAHDNTLIYGARNDIVQLGNSVDPNIPATVRIIPRAHLQKVVSIGINKNWGKTNKYIVSSGQDKIVKIWNADTLKKKIAHNGHANSNVIAASFAGDERVISVSEDGNIIVYNISLNQQHILSNLLGVKVTVTCMSICPHSTFLVAFGLKSGLVVVADLRKNGKVLHKLRGHDKSVVSLSWCPAPINIFPKIPGNCVGVKKQEKEELVIGTVKNNDERDDPDWNKNLQSHDIQDEEQAAGSSKEQSAHHESNGSDGIIINSTNNIKNENVDCETSNNLLTHVKPLSNACVTYLDEDFAKYDVNTQNISVQQNGSSQSDKQETFENDIPKEKPQNVSLQEEPRKEYLLASSAKEDKIYIWRAGTDGRLQTFLTLPSKSNNRKSHNPNKMWITLCWITPTKLLSSSKNAELLQWNLPKPLGFSSKPMSIIHNDHHSQLFNIVGPVKHLDEYNWLDETELNVWTVGHDRLLKNTSLAGGITLSWYPTFGGSISCLQLSPLDPNRLSIGTNDGFIKLLDLSKPNIKKVNLTNFYQKIQSKVTSLAWHPSKDLYLAYGTLEGRVGYLDVSNPSKQPVLFPQYFKTQIHKVEYGILNGNKDEFALYAISGGDLVWFNPKNPKEDPVLIDKPDGSYIFTFSWKPNYNKLVVSTKKNSLITYSSDLKIESTKYLGQKIQDICWHPDASNEHETGSKYSNCFASISDWKNVLIFSIGQETEDDLVIFKYETQSELINNISWSPYEISHLAIATEVGLGMILDVEKNVTIATFHTLNFDPLVTMLWSPLDMGLMICGAKDQTLRIWKILDHPPKDEKELINIRKRRYKEIQAQIMEFLPKDVNIEQNDIKPKKSCKSLFLPKFYTNKNNQTEVISDLRKLLSWKENPVDGITNNNPGEVDILDAFGPKINLINLLKANERVLKTRGQYNQMTQLSLFRGDMVTAVREAITEKRVTPLIISLAPMISPKVWQEACLTYADQLSQEPDVDPLEVATYYLACHKIEEAIDSLCQWNMFKEALILAKCRLMENDNTILTVIEKWAKHSLLTGNFETSAQFYILLGKYEDASSVLFRRSDPETLKFAGELAEKSGNIELYNAVMIRYNAFSSATVNGKLSENENGSSSQKNSTNTDCYHVLSNTDVLVKNTNDTENLSSIQIDTISEFEESLICDTKSSDVEDNHQLI